MDCFESINNTRKTHNHRLHKRRIAKLLILVLLLSIFHLPESVMAATTNCGTCNGTGTIDCPMTNDTNHTHYLYKQHMVNGEYHSWACWTCGNDGRVDVMGTFKCYICDPENPQVDLDNNYYIGCDNCGQSGRCPSCGGNQYSIASCKTCNQENKGSCNKCKGFGRVYAKTCTLCGSPNYGGEYIGVIGSEDCTNCGAAGYIYCWKCPHCGVCDDSANHVKHTKVDCPDCEDGKVDVEKYTITVKADPANAGTTLGSGTYDAGTILNINATANSGWSFVGWEDNTNESSSRQVFVTETKTYTAKFEKGEVEIKTVVAEGKGTTTGDGSYPYNATARIEAIPEEGWEFDHWEIYKTSDNSLLDERIKASTTVTANYPKTAKAFFKEKDDKVIVTTSSNPVKGGTTTGGGIYKKEDSVTVTATANEGYEFVQWLINGVPQTEGKTSVTFIAKTDTDCIAIFNEKGMVTFTIVAAPQELRKEQE